MYGLVLAGGKSLRMGQDKGLIQWHGKAQRYYLADLLKSKCQQVFISCRDDQAAEIEQAGYQPLPDSHDAQGQYGAILTAMAAHPKVAWLVVACDLPLFNAEVLNQLINQRNPGMLATAYKNAQGLPEPLAAIWEPASQAMLLQKLAQGITCPRKALIASAPNVKLIEPPRPQAIMNVNTPAQAQEAKSYAA